MIEGNGDMTVGNYKLGLVENICTKINMLNKQTDEKCTSVCFC